MNVSHDLAVVIPAYNEEACIVHVVDSWLRTLTELGVSFEITVLDDGSCDGTAQALAVFETEDGVRLVSKPNSGHGPTILEGYAHAVTVANWVFQCDGDNEVSANQFPVLWEIRDSYDGIFGIRTQRAQSIGRLLISAASRLAVALAYGKGVADVNVPYRLMRSNVLAAILPKIPADTFAPNLVIAGAFASMHARIGNVPVTHRNRATGTVSITSWRLWKAAFRALGQLIVLIPRIRSLAKTSNASTLEADAR